MAAVSIAVGLVGSGVVARQHVAALEHAGCFKVVAVYDVDKVTANEFANSVGPDVVVTGNLDELISLSDLVVVASPHGFHADMAIAALSAGRHVLVEKPMATTAADCDRMIEAATENNVVVWPGQQQRHYPGVAIAKEVLDSGGLGEPLLYLDRRDGDYRPTRASRRWHFDKRLAGGGIAMNLGVHVIDRMLWLLGAQPVSIQARYAVPEGYEVEMAAFGAVDLGPGGPGASFTLSGASTSVEHHTAIICAEGHIVISDDETVIFGEDGTTCLRMSGDDQYQKSFAGQYEALALTILDGVEPTITPAEGRTVVALVEALYASAVANGQPVDLTPQGSLR